MENICIDFDGVIHIMKGYDEHYDGWKNGKIEGELAPGAKEAIEKLQKTYNVIVFTTRTDLESISRWLVINGICGRGIQDIIITNKKPKAVAYIDDKAIRFESWDQVMDDINEHIGNEDAEINRKIQDVTKLYRKCIKAIEKDHKVSILYTLKFEGIENEQ